MITYSFYLLATLCYLSFIWSVGGVFKTQESHYQSLFTSLKITSIAFWAYSLYLFQATSSIPLELLTVGLVTSLLSLSLFFWATLTIRNEKFSTVYGKDIPEKVLRKGPYKIIRNPFYSSYILCYIGVSITLQSFILLSLLCLLIVLYLIAIKIEENKFSYSPDFSTFVDYRKETGKLIPKPTSLFKKAKK